MNDMEVDYDDKVLVPHEKDKMSGATTYLGIEAYQNETGLKGQALKDDLDKKAILIKSDAGTYLTKGGYHTSIRVDTSQSKADQTAERDTTFKEKMDELGLSDKSFAKVNPKTKDFERYSETPSGEKRLKAFNWEHPEQAGQNSPDILLRRNGTFEANWLSTEGGPKSIKDFEANGFGRQDVMLKTSGNNYQPVDIIDARQGTGAAEKQIAKLAGVVLRNERPDDELKLAFYKAEEGVYLSKEKFDASNVGIDRASTQALFQGATGYSMLNSSTLKFVEKDIAVEKFLAEGLPPKGISTPMNVNWPKVLVALDDETLISGERAAAFTNGRPLDEVFPGRDIYIENIGKKGGTGNYINKTAFERNPNAAEVYDRLVTLGVTAKDPAAARLAAQFSSFDLASRSNGQSPAVSSRGTGVPTPDQQLSSRGTDVPTPDAAPSSSRGTDVPTPDQQLSNPRDRSRDSSLGL